MKDSELINFSTVIVLFCILDISALYFCITLISTYSLQFTKPLQTPNSTTTMSMAMRRVVCSSARAFVSPIKEGGGNPVDIFLSSQPTTLDERVKLAKTCPWESIVIESENRSSSSGSLPTFHFHMPSGEEVSFCGREFILGLFMFIVLTTHLLPFSQMYFVSLHIFHPMAWRRCSHWGMFLFGKQKSNHRT